MVPMHFKASWDEEREEMIVSLSFPPEAHFAHVTGKELKARPHVEHFVERLTRQQWRSYIDNLDAAPLRVGGLLIETRDFGDKRREIEDAIKRYMRQVDDAFQLTGKTEWLR